MPHQIRGFLARFNTMLISGAAYNKCTACSETVCAMCLIIFITNLEKQVLSAYENNGFDMLLQSFNNPAYLEHLTGLDQVQAETEAILGNIDWDDEED